MTPALALIPKDNICTVYRKLFHARVRLADHLRYRSHICRINALLGGLVLTLAEAAKYLKVSERTLWQLAKDGEIPHRRVGKQYRFVYSILLAWAKDE